jgi:ligand-binding sensor domain-containing protein/anti-sigma regulatory factor (Ser/Thr protein kinase)
MNQLIFIMLSWLCIGKIVYAQHPFYYTINDENGLPSNEVYQLVQDDFGYIWIGCDAGLFRYDGFRYKEFKTSFENGKSKSLLTKDHKGRIWCQNFNGQIYRIEGDSLLLINDLSGSNFVNSLFALDDGNNAWIVKNGHLIQLNDLGDSVYAFTIPNTDIFTVTALQYSKNQLFFANFKGQLFIFDIIAKKLQLHPSFSSPKDNVLLKLFKNKQQLLVVEENVFTKNYELYELTDVALKKINSFTNSDGTFRIFSFCIDNVNSFWICSNSGAIRCAEEHNIVTIERPLLPYKKVSYIMQDREGMYWISTLDEGVFVIPEIKVKHLNTTNSALTESNITALWTKGNLVYLGTHSGNVFSYNSTTQKLNQLRNGGGVISVKKISDFNHHILVSNGYFRGISDKAVQLSQLSNIRDFCVVGDTLYFVQPECTGSISLSQLFTLNAEELANKISGGGRVMCYHPQQEQFYYGLSHGLYVDKNVARNEIMFNDKKIYATSIQHYKGSIYVADPNLGVLVISLFGGKELLQSAYPQLETSIKWLHISDRYIWLSGNEALWRIDKLQKKIVQFNHLTGIPHKDIQAITSSNGIVYLGTKKGLVYFEESLSPENTIAPTLAIENSIAENAKQGTNQTTIYLPYSTNSLQIDLTSISLRSKGEYDYQYRVIGLDNNWVNLVPSYGKLIFPSLPSGEFQLEVKAINESGVESETISLYIVVDYPIWERWWFYVLAMIMGFFIMAFLFKWRVNYIRKREREKTALINSELTALKAQMNPHFMYNALNSIQALILKKDIKSSNLYLSQFSRLMRKVLEISGKLEISIQEEVETLELYLSLEQLRFGAEFNYEIIVQKDLDAYSCYIPPLLLQPFVENAIKHGLLHKKGDKKLTISFQKEHDTLVCMIKDNGIGRVHAQEIKDRQREAHHSFSTSATQKRIELLNNVNGKNLALELIDLYENNEPSGTQVMMKIPI